MNPANETEIVVFQDDRIFLYSDVESDTDSSFSNEDAFDTPLPDLTVDIYNPTEWDDIQTWSFRHRPTHWRWADWELFHYI